jgi:hypothetical protein
VKANDGLISAKDLAKTDISALERMSVKQALPDRRVK